jgi:hypothetical protein
VQAPTKPKNVQEASTQRQHPKCLPVLKQMFHNADNIKFLASCKVNGSDFVTPGHVKKVKTSVVAFRTAGGVSFGELHHLFMIATSQYFACVKPVRFSVSTAPFLVTAVPSSADQPLVLVNAYDLLCHCSTLPVPRSLVSESYVLCHSFSGDVKTFVVLASILTPQ